MKLSRRICRIIHSLFSKIVVWQHTCTISRNSQFSRQVATDINTKQWNIVRLNLPPYGDFVQLLSSRKRFDNSELVSAAFVFIFFVVVLLFLLVIFVIIINIITFLDLVLIFLYLILLLIVITAVFVFFFQLQISLRRCNGQFIIEYHSRNVLRYHSPLFLRNFRHSGQRALEFRHFPLQEFDPLSIRIAIIIDIRPRDAIIPKNSEATPIPIIPFIPIFLIHFHDLEPYPLLQMIPMRIRLHESKIPKNLRSPPNQIHELAIGTPIVTRKHFVSRPNLLRGIDPHPLGIADGRLPRIGIPPIGVVEHVPEGDEGVVVSTLFDEGDDLFVGGVGGGDAGGFEVVVDPIDGVGSRGVVGEFGFCGGVFVGEEGAEEVFGGGGPQCWDLTALLTLEKTNIRSPRRILPRLHLLLQLLRQQTHIMIKRTPSIVHFLPLLHVQHVNERLARNSHQELLGLDVFFGEDSHGRGGGGSGRQEGRVAHGVDGQFVVEVAIGEVVYPGDDVVDLLVGGAWRDVGGDD
mmetsp:Transcript_22478/g.45551  ORF Transcript_22478/g.45551 Transcript_22478/m.45551 type:complete len:519 (-) Transcript_22478:114-1670(-)